MGKKKGMHIWIYEDSHRRFLKFYIKASSNPGNVVFDPFCGCATIIEVAHKLGRRWVGCDIALHAIKCVISVRLRKWLGLQENIDFEIDGISSNLERVKNLWERDQR